MKRKLLSEIGWRETISMPGLGVTGISAKVDTGARTSSLHAEILDEIERDGKRFLRFAYAWQDERRECEAAAIDVRDITSSNGETQERYVIQTQLQVGTHRFSTEISLADRSDMKFPMLLGRSALRGRFLVDSSRSWLQSSKPVRA